MRLFNFQTTLFTIAAILSGISCQLLETIVGGSYARPGEFPYQVALRHNNGLHFCGGNIISRTHILTAAHCVQEFHSTLPIKSFYVLSGTYDLRSGGQFHTVKSITIHPQYMHMANTNEFKNNIAIITLVRLIQFNSIQMPIRIATRDDYVGSEGVTSGWGYEMESDHLSSSPVLKKLRVMIESDEQCNTSPTQFCTSTFSNSDTCTGDSGGGLVVRNELVGILSYNVGCTTESGSLYTKVFKYRDFIMGVIGDQSLNDFPNYLHKHFFYKLPFFNKFSPGHGYKHWNH